MQPNTFLFPINHTFQQMFITPLWENVPFCNQEPNWPE